MKKLHSKTARHKAPRRGRSGHESSELDRGWHELEAQHDRIKSDWMSLAVQLGVGGRDRVGF